MKKAMLWATLGSYLISLLLPIATGPEVRPQALPGGLVLVLGSFSFVGAARPSWCGFSWLANPLLAISLLSSRRPELQKLSSLGALALACLFLGVREITVNEAGSMVEASPGPAYWFWMQSMLLANVWAWIPGARKQPAEQGPLQ